MSEKNKSESLKCAIDLMEIETLYFTGKTKAIARRKYHRLLRLCGKRCHYGDSIFLNRQ